MTEYDFSPQAVIAYNTKLDKIADWVDDTKRQPPANPFTPATPAVHALQIRGEGDDNRHRRKDPRNVRDRPRDRAINAADIRQQASSPTSARRSNRSHSASYTTATARPDPTRGRTLPAPLQLPPQNGYISSGKPASPTYAHFGSTPKLMSPRDSKHSSRTSSSTWLPTNPHYSQPTPHSAPVIPRAMRSQTTPPNYTHPMEHAAYQNASGYLPVRSTPFIACPHCPDPEICSLKQNAPQFPHSYYQPKPPPLFKRLFMNWGSNKQHKPPRRKRSSSF